MWNQEYLNNIIERTNKRISSLSQKMAETRPGQQIPEENQITIGSGRQLDIAVLFLDICHYSQWFNDSYEAQQLVLALMNIFMAEMINIVRDHKGEFEKNTGDGLMAYFRSESGRPVDTVTMAIDAALTMHYFNDYLLSPYLTQRGLQKIDFRIGIDYGKTTIGKVGIPGGLNTFVAIGTKANVACKLLNIASTGEIVVGQHVKDILPSYRQNYCQLIFLPTGFEYIVTKTPYWAYKYTGRWIHPA